MKEEKMLCRAQENYFKHIQYDCHHHNPKPDKKTKSFLPENSSSMYSVLL